MSKAFTRGYVRVRPAKKAGCWQLDWQDPETGKRIQKRVRAASVQEARAIADHFNREVAAGRGILPAQRSWNPSVDDAMREAIAASRGNLKTRAEYSYIARSFGRWLNESRPGVTRWAEVMTKTVRDFVHFCQTEGRSDDIVRKRLYLVKMTSRYMAETYEDHFADVAAHVRFERKETNPLEAKERERAKALPVAALAILLDYLSERRPDLYAIACLQGLAGMRAMEAAHVREQDIDFSAGTVTITKTPDHTPKNKASYRVIPVASRPLRALRAVLDGLKVRHPHGYLFATARRDAPWSTSDYSHAMQRELRECARIYGGEAERLRDFQPHWLRATFVSLVRAFKVDFRILQGYIGHAPSDTMGRHYEILSSEQLRTEIIPAVERICEHVCERSESEAL
jgi:integrase